MMLPVTSGWFEIIHCPPPTHPSTHPPATQLPWSEGCKFIQELESKDWNIWFFTQPITAPALFSKKSNLALHLEPDLTKRLLFFIFTMQWGRWLEQTPLCSNCFFQFQTFGWCNWFRSLLEKNFLQRILNSCLILKFGIASPFCHSDANSDAAHHLRHSPRHCIASDWTAIFNVL